VGVFTIEQPQVIISPPSPVGIFLGATCEVTPVDTSINEGSPLVFNISTTNIINNTRLYWTIFGGPNVTSADFAPASGSFLINNNAGTASVSLVNDKTTEGSEFFYLEIRTNSTSGDIIATSRSVTINDTSFVFFRKITASVSETTELRDYAITQGWDQVQRLEIQIDRTARLTGSATDISSYNGTDSPTKHRRVAGLVVSGSFPGGLIIRNDGVIIGRGGNGGNAGVGGNSGGSPGGRGGPGLVFVTGVTAEFITVINTGFISGGGGGGGGGAGWSSGNRGGGGGGGAPLGAGGISGGRNATDVDFGAGGIGDTGYSAGGTGGGQGLVGNPGRGARPGFSGTGGLGGAAGLSIVGTNFITTITTTGSGIVRGGQQTTGGAA
jgi:hypothetical protein